MRQHEYDEVDRRVLADIEKHGWTDIGVFPTKESQGVPWNYTVGLCKADQPELVVMGLNNQQAHHVLWSAISAMRNGKELVASSYCDEVLQGVPVGVVEVLDLHHPDYPLSMVTHLFGEVPALQLVWPDRAGRFPWHDDFDPEFIDRQVLLGPWLGEV